MRAKGREREEGRGRKEGWKRRELASAPYARVADSHSQNYLKTGMRHCPAKVDVSRGEEAQGQDKGTLQTGVDQCRKNAHPQLRQVADGGLYVKVKVKK